MAENEQKPLKTAFTAADRIQAQLPELHAFSLVMAEVSEGRASPPNALQAMLTGQKVEAVAFWLGVLQSALCDLETGAGSNDD
ncbi:hypothetical protein A9320_24805 [Ruegeria sp. PBVC088]|nr:hypothetical protein A9320_24805 [Ruegeria sp. PBVC088]